jgi:hypothetical protein
LNEEHQTTEADEDYVSIGERAVMNVGV